jgi:penicillin-binding protein 2
MTPFNHPVRRFFFAFILLVFVSASFESTVFARGRRAAGRARAVRRERGRKLSARERRADRRRGRHEARSSRRERNRPLTARERRQQRQLVAREQSSALSALARKLHRPLTKRERAAELRRITSSRRREIEEARRRAEAARLAAIARQRALDKAMRDEVQGMISRDDPSGEDPEVRRVAINALGNHAGTVVVMDPMNGRVYSIVNQEWALRRGFKPCSTIKLVTGVAGLSEKVISPFEGVDASERSRMDLTSALAHSNNPYFERVGSNIGFDKMVTYARELGLGEKTGTNFNYEYPGRLPEMKPGFAVHRMFSYADGFEVTALQLGTLVSAMANGGKLMVPHTPRSTQEQQKFKPKVRRTLEIDSSVWQRMIPGMVGAVNYGSGRRAYDPTQTVAGKTGTCIGQGGWVGLFTSYAPLANPRLAVVVITQGTDAHRHLPAAVAGQIYRDLSHRFGTPTNFRISPTPDDEENDVAADEGMTEEQKAANGTNTAAVTTSASESKPGPTQIQPRNTVKRVLMPIGSNPGNRNPEPGAKITGGSRPAATSAPPTDNRPRRAQPNP